MSDATWLVVGLGNPGSTYAGTRHNIGHLVVDELAARTGSRFKAHRSRCDTAETRLAGGRAVLAKPRSYMNESGGPVASLRDYFKSDPAHLIVIHDELDIPFGALRVKLGGGDNGHNGLKSIRGALGTGDFLRVRAGIGRPPGRQAPADFVLKPFSATERKDLEWHVVRAADSVESLIEQGLERTQTTYNADPE
jgi:PTH1 family peptidyl-tRNA hydrolase